MKLKFYLLLFLFLISTYSNAETLLANVIGVSDGDTITVIDTNNEQYKIRLAGIDAPEKKQPYGNKSKQSLSDLIYGKQVLIHWAKTDRYKRLLGKVVFKDLDINNEQLKRGMAWFYFKYENELAPRDRKLYLQSYQEAVDKGAGLWADKNPTAPWDFRKH